MEGSDGDLLVGQVLLAYVWRLTSTVVIVAGMIGLPLTVTGGSK